MNKKQTTDYYKGVIFIIAFSLLGMLFNKVTELLLLVLCLIGMRFVALSRNNNAICVNSEVRDSKLTRRNLVRDGKVK